ncbi:MAG TPA: hypothetical protein VD993_20655 [Chitinophagaceae bacterium]|nr:hypothetical protein [Chitinophagaceae bacterium]
MIEYLLMIVFMTMAYLLFRNKYLQNRKWFVITHIVLMLGIIAYLLIDSASIWNGQKVVLLILVVGSVVYTLVKKAYALRRKK